MVCMPQVDTDLLVAAIAGYEEMRRQIEGRIAELSSRIDGMAREPVRAYGRKEHVISVAGRARIAAAQRKRWAAFKSAKARRAKLSQDDRKSSTRAQAGNATAASGAEPASITNT